EVSPSVNPDGSFGGSGTVTTPIEIRADEVSLTRSSIRGFQYRFHILGPDFVSIEARSVRLADGSQIDISTSNSAKLLHIRASDQVVLEGGSRIQTSGDEIASGILIEDL